LVLNIGETLHMPDIFVFGLWAAILMGTIFLGFYVGRVTDEIHSMSEALLATQMALSREQKLTDLGGVIAAAAHELGTPLATIKLVSTELVDDLKEFPILQEDAELIREQADRCRDILHSMGRAGKDDLHLKFAPAITVVETAAEPHINRGKTVHIHTMPNKDGLRQPEISRQPEIIHGLRNLIQNAVDFADHNVWVDVSWTSKTVKIKIIDDGNGFPPHLIGRIGDPFVRKRKPAAECVKRPGYEGMGLGLFIAKTLLERSGAEVGFVNGCDPFLIDNERPDRCGAIVEVCWPRKTVCRDDTGRGKGLGENKLFST
jgi:two-component system sensor histidine kinase RegB